MHEAPSLENWFGTDQFGRDVFSRIVYGARTALLVGFLASFVGAFDRARPRGRRAPISAGGST